MTSRVNRNTCAAAALALFGLVSTGPAEAAVSAEEAAQLGKTLTPFGAIKAGNDDGSIPAWTGGMTSDPLYKKGGRRDHLFAGDKPLFSVTAQNMDQYADHLSEMSKEMFKAYPDTYRIDVYPTVRSAAAPQWVYDNTLKNATRGQLVDGPLGPMPKGVYGGLPFPIPKSGIEVMWNSLMLWKGVAWNFDFHIYQVTAQGKPVLLGDMRGIEQQPYYLPGGSAEQFESPTGTNGLFSEYILRTQGPPLRAGEAILQQVFVNSENDSAWIYLTGQRRVRKLPNACCDTPHPASAGLLFFDEVFGLYGRMDRFDWTLVGKKEMFIPYNCNQLMKSDQDATVMGAHHINPDVYRWEKHRVWVVDANLKPGQRHLAPKGRYYMDEDTGAIVLIDRWDAKDNPYRSVFEIPFAAPDLPGQIFHSFGFYDLTNKNWFLASLYNEFRTQYEFLDKPRNQVEFTPEAIAGEGIR